MPFRRLKQEKNLLDLPCLGGMPTKHELAKRWMAVRLRVEHETWKRVKGVTRNRYWKKMIAAGQEEVWLTSSRQTQRWNNTDVMMHAETGARQLTDWWVTRSKAKLVQISQQERTTTG
jgi:hypothetical protein